MNGLNRSRCKGSIRGSGGRRRSSVISDGLDVEEIVRTPLYFRSAVSEDRKVSKYLREMAALRNFICHRSHSFNWRAVCSMRLSVVDVKCG